MSATEPADPNPGEAAVAGPELDARARAAAAAPFVVIGGLCIIVGGLISAIAASLPAQVHTSVLSWVSAYLVLVAGVAAIGFGIGQAALGRRVPASWLLYVELVVFYAGNAAVIAGTLARQPLVTDAGGLLLVVAVLLFIFGARGARGTRLRWVLYLYRALLVVVLVSIPIGLILAHLRAA